MTSMANHPAEVLLRRRAVRRSFLDFATFALAEQNMSPALHHRRLIQILQDVAEGRLHRVIVLMPPGSAKSLYTSILFPIWYLATHSTNLILACSYSYNLIEGFGRQCRDLIERYEKELGISLSTSACAAGDWRLANNLGGYFCAGVNAGIAGHRADLAFIDDFIGTQEEADSKVIRDKNYFWYRNDFVPRLKPQAARIIIANRRHEDDLVGRLLATEADKWTVIKFPMLAEENDPLGRAVGERLWPEWFTDDQVQEAKKESRTWAGLYQQRPRPDEGNFFKANTFVGYTLDELAAVEKAGLRKYVGADYAFRKGQENDFNCFLPAGVDSSNRLWILPDWFWQKADAGEAVEAQIDMARKHRPIVWWAGKENITGAVEPFLNKRMQETNVYISVEQLSEHKDKQAKAQSIKARMSQRMVLFPKFHPEWEKAENELLTFPGAIHDDFVDALSKLGYGLDKMTPASVQPTTWTGTLPGWKPTLEWMKASMRSRQAEERVALLDK